MISNVNDKSLAKNSGFSTTAVVLAGGSSSRIGNLGRILPKCLLAVSVSETLLSRLLTQLTEAAVEEIVVSTTVQFAPLLREFIAGYISETTQLNLTVPKISVFSNDGHSLGPCIALINVLRNFAANRFLVCLSDIYFYENPFAYFLSAETKNDVALLGSQYESDRGGVMIVDYDAVVRLSYLPLNSTPHQHTVLNWTGTAWINEAAKQTIVRANFELTDAPLESLFILLMASGHPLTVRIAGKFVNVNRFDDYLRIVLDETGRIDKSDVPGRLLCNLN
jgi:NDP-sugar pyrophosphorylase family protein